MKPLYIIGLFIFLLLTSCLDDEAITDSENPAFVTLQLKAANTSINDKPNPYAAPSLGENKTSGASMRALSDTQSSAAYVKLPRFFTMKGKAAHRFLAVRYATVHLGSTVRIILSVAFGCCLIYGLSYAATLAKADMQISREVNFFNGDYILTAYDDTTAQRGITEQTLEAIKNAEHVRSVETQSALPVKVVDTGVTRRDDYYKRVNETVLRIYDFPLVNRCGKTDVYLTKLKGYSKEAVIKLERYLAEGAFSYETLGDDEIVIAMPRSAGEGETSTIGFFKTGEGLMDYEVGDKVSMLYRKDLNTDSPDYWTCQDDISEYGEKTFTVKAIVYYPYMKTSSPLEQGYPLFITTDKAYHNLTDTDIYSSINVNVDPQLPASEQREVEETLIQLGVKNQEVTARSMIEEQKKIDTLYHKRLTYIYGTAVVVFVLIMINLINSLKYRLLIRQREFAVYRAIGGRDRFIRKMITAENMGLGVVASGIFLALTKPITDVLYARSRLEIYGDLYQYNLVPFAVICIVTLLICAVLSVVLSKEICKRKPVSELSGNKE